MTCHALNRINASTRNVDPYRMRIVPKPSPSAILAGSPNVEGRDEVHACKNNDTAVGLLLYAIIHHEKFVTVYTLIPDEFRRYSYLQVRFAYYIY